MKGQYMRLFRKTEDDTQRFWASISEAKTDKKGRKTDEYVTATIPARLSEDAKKQFAENVIKTKKKSIVYANVLVKEMWLKPVSGQDSDFVILFVNDLECVQPKDDEEGDE